MSRLFESSNIKGLQLSNRFVRSATWEGLAAADGSVTPKLTDMMVQLSTGEIGLIISSHAYVLSEGQGSPFQIGIYKDEFIPECRKMTDAIHSSGGKIVMQIAHAGNYANTKITGQSPIVVSNFEGLSKSKIARKELTTEGIQNIIDAFSHAANRAKAAGFDGVQLHSAHGYLLSQFLSPHFNRRVDEYGGSIENRSRIHVEICRSIRRSVGEDFPIMIKINSQDYIENGLTLEDSIRVGQLLSEAGLDALELSGGVLTSGDLSPSRTGVKSKESEAYFSDDARIYKKEIDIPLILVGGIRSIEVADRIINEGVADYISLSRPLLREPNLIKRWKEGDTSPTTCKSDNLCFQTGYAGEGVYCKIEKRG